MNERRRSFHHERVMWDGGVISRAAAFCHEFGENPDLHELMQYNTAARARECTHKDLRYIDTGEREFYSCDGCDLSDPNWRKKFVECKPCWWRRNPDCSHCRGTGLIPKG